MLGQASLGLVRELPSQLIGDIKLIFTELTLRPVTGQHVLTRKLINLNLIINYLITEYSLYGVWFAIGTVPTVFLITCVMMPTHVVWKPAVPYWDLVSVHCLLLLLRVLTTSCTVP